MQAYYQIFSYLDKEESAYNQPFFFFLFFWTLRSKSHSPLGTSASIPSLFIPVLEAVTQLAGETTAL